MSFLVLPPEINSMLMHSGAGSAPMLEAASAWHGLASELGAAASSFSSVTSGLTSQAWQGPAAQAMAAAAAPYAGWLTAAAAHAADAGQQAGNVASVFEAARASMVHPVAIAANRTGFVQLVMSNLFGQNAPAIAAAEGVYEEMWAQDVDAMVGYHAGASAAANGIVAGKFNIGPGVGRNLAQLFKRLPKAINRLRKADEKLGGEIKKREDALGAGFIRDVNHIGDEIGKAFTAPTRNEFLKNLNMIVRPGLPPIIAPGGGIGIIRRL
jgi:PPE-repeat protein